MNVSGMCAVATLMGLWSFAAPSTPARQASTYTVNIAGGASAVRCQYQVMIVAKPRGLGDNRASPTLGRIVFDTSPSGLPAQSLRSFIYCPGYALSSIEERSLETLTTRSTTITPVPLGIVRVTGHVNFPEGEKPPSDLPVDVTHFAEWIVEHYGTWDGTVPQFVHVGAARLGPDHTFTLDLPNFARDPWVSRFHARGTFEFALLGDRGIPSYDLKDVRVVPAIPARPPAWIMSEGVRLPDLDVPAIDITFEAKPRRY
jgi:hypothetical protein